jgi:hypothetical protein
LPGDAPPDGAEVPELLSQLSNLPTESISEVTTTIASLEALRAGVWNGVDVPPEECSLRMLMQHLRRFKQLDLPSQPEPVTQCARRYGMLLASDTIAGASYCRTQINRDVVEVLREFISYAASEFNPSQSPNTLGRTDTTSAVTSLFLYLSSGPDQCETRSDTKSTRSLYGKCNAVEFLTEVAESCTPRGSWLCRVLINRLIDDVRPSLSQKQIRDLAQSDMHHTGHEDTTGETVDGLRDTIVSNSETGHRQEPPERRTDLRQQCMPRQDQLSRQPDFRQRTRRDEESPWSFSGNRYP